MSTIDYQPSQHAIRYERPSTTERLATEQLDQATLNTGPIDLTHNVPIDEVPD